MEAFKAIGLVRRRNKKNAAEPRGTGRETDRRESGERVSSTGSLSERVWRCVCVREFVEPILSPGFLYSDDSGSEPPPSLSSLPLTLTSREAVADTPPLSHSEEGLSSHYNAFSAANNHTTIIRNTSIDSSNGHVWYCNKKNSPKTNIFTQKMLKTKSYRK